MPGLQDTAAAAAKLAGGAGGHGGGTLSMVGVGGWALEWKHGSAALIEPFADCDSFGEGLIRLSTMNDATFLGLGLFVAIMVVSTVSLCLGIYRLSRRFLIRPAGAVTPPGQGEESDS